MPQMLAVARYAPEQREAIVAALSPIDEFRAAAGRRVVANDEEEEEEEETEAEAPPIAVLAPTG